MSAENFDLVVVGAGPGGYVAAVRAAGLGMKTAVIEKEARPGGVCLNVGCIPSKALLESTEQYSIVGNRLGEHGISVADVSFDLAGMMERKEKIVSGLAENVRALVQHAGAKLVHGFARLKPGLEVEVAGADGTTASLKAKSILLATGSEPVSLPFLPFDGDRVVDSTGALRFDAVPERLGIIGGGYIGLELGSVWARLGSKVTIIEVLPRIAMGLDSQVGRLLDRLLRREGLDIRVETRALQASKSENGVKLLLDSGGRREETFFDKVLVSVGRRPLTRDLGIEDLGIRLDRKGSILVDEAYRTSVPGVYAIGDLIPGPMLAHKASAEGIAAVEMMAGLPGEVNYDAIPAVVYTSPEAASVGKTEDELKELGIEYRSGVYPFSGTGRARCIGETDGFVKILARPHSGRILGVHIIGPRASELIAEAVAAIQSRMSVDELRRTVHAHPTLAEAIHECAAAIAEKPGG